MSKYFWWWRGGPDRKRSKNPKQKIAGSRERETNDRNWANEHNPVPTARLLLLREKRKIRHHAIREMIMNAPIMINKYHQCFFWSSIVRMKSGSREGRHECIAQTNDRKYRLSFLTTSIEFDDDVFFLASYSAHLRSNANGKSEKQSVRTWTLVALRPATEAICWVAANMMFMSRCKSVREWGIECDFRKFIRKAFAMNDDGFAFFARGGVEIFSSNNFIPQKGVFWKRNTPRTRKRKRRCECYGNTWTITSRQRICTLMTWLKRITAIYILPKRKTFSPTSLHSLSFLARTNIYRTL